MKNIKKLAMTALVGVICFSAGRFLSPKKIETREVEKIVYREATDTKIDSTRTSDKKETILPDGTRIIETTSSIQRTTDKKTNTELNSEREKISVVTNRPDWHVTLTYKPQMFANDEQSYGIDIQRRIISELYVGATVDTNRTLGISIGLGF